MENKKYSQYVLYTLLIVYMVSIVDRHILSLLMEPIKQDLDLSDTQLGFLSGIAFALFYTTLGIPIARLADRGHRVNIISVSLILWSGMTVVCGFAANFWQLIVARVGVGIGEAGCTPPAHSLIADYFEKSERGRALSMYMMGVPLGTLVGLLLGGWINEYYGWRMAFISLGIPGLVLAILVKATIREPRCSPSSGMIPFHTTSSNNNLKLLESLSYLWSHRVYRFLVIAMALHTFVGIGVGQWIATYLVRRYELGTGEIGFWLALSGGGAGILGTYLGGLLATRIAPDDEARQMRFVGIIASIMIIPFVAYLFWPNKYGAILWLGVANTLWFMHVGPCYALIQTLAPSHLRATAVALVFLIINLIGMGLGPQIVGLLSDLLFPIYAQNSLGMASLLVLSIAVLAGWIFWLTGNEWRDHPDKGIEKPRTV